MTLGFVYAIDDGADHIKIGFASNPVRRLSELNVASATPYTLVGYLAGTKRHEKILHRLFKKQKLRGEWFQKSGVVLSFVSRLPAPEQKRIGSTNSFREIIDAFGNVELATIIGVAESHIRVMAARDSIPPKYWRALLEASKPDMPLSLALLDDLYNARFPRNAPPTDLESAA